MEIIRELIEIPRELRVLNEGEIHVRMPMTAEYFYLGKQPRYEIRQVIGDKSTLLASIAIQQTGLGYEILRRFNLEGQKPSKISFNTHLEHAKETAEHEAVQLGVQLADGTRQIPLMILVDDDKKDLEAKINERGSL